MKHRLKIFEYRALRKIFGPKRQDVTREWGKLFYSLTNVITVIK
jgi:hypothetical protein